MLRATPYCGSSTAWKVALTKSMWEISPRQDPVMWCVSTHWHVLWDNELQYLTGSRSFSEKNFYMFYCCDYSSIAVTTKLNTVCVSPRHMACIGASLNSRATSKVSPLRLRISAGRWTWGNYSLKNGLIYLPELHSHIKGAYFVRGNVLSPTSQRDGAANWLASSGNSS